MKACTKLWKRICVLGFVIISLYGIYGCQKHEMIQKQEPKLLQEKVLTESEIDLPEHLQMDSNITFIIQGNNCKIAELTVEGAIQIWERQDSEWRQKLILPKDLDAATILNSYKIMQNGTIWYSVKVDNIDKNYRISSQGEIKEFNVDILGSNANYGTEIQYTKRSVENRIFKFCSSDEIVIAVDLFGNIYKIDPEQAVVKECYDLKRQEDIKDAFVIDDSIIEFTKNQIYCYSVTDGSSKETAFLEFLKKEYMADEILGVQQVENNVYIMSKNKLDIFNLNKNNRDEIILIDSPNLLRNDIFFEEMYIKNSSEVYALLYEKSVGIRLFKYSLQKEKIEKTKLTAFCLSPDKVQNSGIEDSITRFNANNPNIEITLSYGIENESATNVTEVINKLNTQMLVGEGPDIILADGLNIESYIKNELLLDLSDEVNRLNQESRLFMNLIHDDKGIYTIPTSFCILGEVVNGKKFIFSEYVNDIVQNLSRLQSENIFSQDSACALIGTILNLKLCHWSEAGDIKDKDIKELLEASKKIYSYAYEAQDTYGEFNIKNAIMYESNVSIGIYELLCGNSRAAVGSILYPEDLFFIKKLSEWNENVKSSVLENEAEKFFIPSGNICVSSQTKNLEGVFKYLEYMLSEEVQSHQISAFPVNRQAFRTRYSRTDLFSGMVYEDNNGKTQTLKNATASLEEIESTEKFLAGLNYDVSVNDALKNILADGIVAYINRSNDLDAASNDVYQKLQIMFAE